MIFVVYFSISLYRKVNFHNLEQQGWPLVPECPGQIQMNFALLSFISGRGFFKNPQKLCLISIHPKRLADQIACSLMSSYQLALLHLSLTL